MSTRDKSMTAAPVSRAFRLGNKRKLIDVDGTVVRNSLPLS